MDREHTLEKPAGVKRAVVIGDSVAAGFFVSLDDSFPRVLEHLLASSGDANRWEVVTLARSGYSTSQELVLLEDEAFTYRPDVIIWSYVLNDPADPIFHNANGQLGRYYTHPGIHIVHLFRRISFRFREGLRAIRLHAPDEFHMRLHALYWGDVERNVARIGELARRHGVPVLFVVQPLVQGFATYRDYPCRELHTRLEALATRAGLTPVDLLGAYGAHTPRELGNDNDPWHPTPLGHRLEAEVLVQALRAHGLSGAR